MFVFSLVVVVVVVLVRGLTTPSTQKSHVGVRASSTGELLTSVLTMQVTKKFLKDVDDLARSRF